MSKWYKLAYRNLFRNRRRSIFTIGAIAFGFAAVNLFGGFTAYVFRGLQDSFVYAAGNGHLAIFKQGFLKSGLLDPQAFLLSKEELQALAAICKTDPRIDTASPQLNISGLLSNGSMSTIMVAEGRVARDVSHIRSMGKGVIGSLRAYEGAELNDTQPHRVGVSRGLADKLGLKTGDSASIMATTVEGMVNAVDVEMIQTLDAQLDILDTMLMGLPLGLARELYHTQGADRLIVVLHDSKLLPHVLRDLTLRCQQQGLAVEIRTWQQLRLSYLRTRNMFNVLFLFMFIIVMVIVLLSVINTISMSVMERTREVGTLRSIGVKRQGLTAMFAVESALLGLAGSLAGILLTLAGWLAITLAKPTWMPPNIPKRVPLEIQLVPEYLAASLIFFVLLAIVAAFIPTRRALRLSIVDALGHI